MLEASVTLAMNKSSTWKGQVAGDTPLGNRSIAVKVGETALPFPEHHRRDQ